MLFWRTNEIQEGLGKTPYFIKKGFYTTDSHKTKRIIYTIQNPKSMAARLYVDNIVCTLFPLEIRMFPLRDKYVVSSQPFASSPRSLNGTGYGTLNGKNLKVNAARSKRKRMRFPSLIVASA
jgi:hypothetical protein